MTPKPMGKDELCAVHHEMQKRLDDRWDAHMETTKEQYSELKTDLNEIFNRLRLLEMRMWMSLGAIAAILFIIEKWPKLAAILR